MSIRILPEEDRRHAERRVEPYAFAGSVIDTRKMARRDNQDYDPANDLPDPERREVREFTDYDESDFLISGPDHPDSEWREFTQQECAVMNRRGR